MTNKQYLSVVGIVLVGFLIRTAVLELNLPHLVDHGSTLHQVGALIYVILIVVFTKVAVKKNLWYRKFAWFYTLVVSGIVLNLLEVTISGVVNFIPADVIFGTSWMSVGDLIVLTGSGVVFVMSIKELVGDVKLIKAS